MVRVEAVREEEVSLVVGAPSSATIAKFGHKEYECWTT